MSRSKVLAQVVKNPAWNLGARGSIPGLGRSPGEGNGNLLQSSCLKNSMDRGAWWATVHGGANSRTQLSSEHTHTHTHTLTLTLTLHAKQLGGKRAERSQITRGFVNSAKEVPYHMNA